MTMDDTRQNAPPPMSLADHQALEKVTKMAIDIAHDYAARLGARPDIELLKQEIKRLQEVGIDSQRKETLLALTQMNWGYIDDSWRLFPESYAVRSYFSDMLEQLIEQFDAPSVTQFFIEYFSQEVNERQLEDIGITEIPLPEFSNKDVAKAYHARPLTTKYSL